MDIEDTAHQVLTPASHLCDQYALCFILQGINRNPKHRDQHHADEVSGQTPTVTCNQWG